MPASERVAHPRGACIRLDEQLARTRSRDRLDHDEPLGRDAALPAVDQPRRGAAPRRPARGRRPRARCTGSLPPSSSTVFFSTRPGLRGDRAARGGRCRSASPATIAGRAMSAVDLPASPISSAAEQRRRGKPASRKSSSIASAQPGTFEACLSRPALPAMSAGRGEAEDLPEREVPGHDGEHRRPSGSKRDVALRARRSRIGSRRRKRLGVLGVVVADPGALLDLGLGPARSACPSRAPSAAPARPASRAGGRAARRRTERALGEPVCRQGYEACARGRQDPGHLGRRGLGVSRIQPARLSGFTDWSGMLRLSNRLQATRGRGTASPHAARAHLGSRSEGFRCTIAKSPSPSCSVRRARHRTTTRPTRASPAGEPSPRSRAAR